MVNSRRGFLTGSTFFAAALLAVAKAGAQETSRQDPPKDVPKDKPRETPKESPKPPKEERRRGPKTDEEIFEEQEKAKQKEELVDDEGRQYRVCPQCGFKMYRQGRTWTCSNCGYNYVD